MSIAVVTVEGVLSQEPDLRTAKPTKWCKPLYEAMRSQFSVMLLTSTEHSIARWWFRQQAISQWSSLQIWPSKGLFDYAEWRIDQIRSYLADGWEISFYLDIDPYVLHKVGEMGLMTLSVSYPDKPPGWRDVHQTTPRPWSRVVDTVDVEGT
jgi:hypothetical protein